MIKMIALGIIILVVVGILALGWGGYKLGHKLFGKKNEANR